MFRDRRFRVALEASLLVHLLLVWLLPLGHRAMRAVLPPTAQVAEPEAASEPIRFELVELPQQREEKPSRANASASDLSRRAHGGEGPQADRPGSQGTTPELRIAPPSEGQLRQESIPAAPSGQPAPQQERPESVAERGAGTLLVEPTPVARPRTPVLKGLSPIDGAARSGGAIPDRRGGQVDLGPLSFDTQWYNWGPYAAEMLRRIRYHWSIPEIARVGAAGVTRIHFVIERNGRVSSIEIERESGHPSMDFAARDAIAKASPLPPLPSDLHGVEHEGVTITFFYNTDPPDD
jgi:TonB family protein